MVLDEIISLMVWEQFQFVNVAQLMGIQYSNSWILLAHEWEDGLHGSWVCYLLECDHMWAFLNLS